MTVRRCTLTVQRSDWKVQRQRRSVYVSKANGTTRGGMVSEQLLQQVMDIIAHAGEGKSLAMEALASCRAGNYVEADRLLATGDVVEVRLRTDEAGDPRPASSAPEHRQILAKSAIDAEMPVSFLLVHAADYMTAAGTCRDLAEEMICMYKEMRHV